MTRPLGPQLVFLDTETTGLHPPKDKVVDIALVSETGEVLLNTLVNPRRPIGYAKKIHGISDEMVRNAPTFDQLWPKIEKLLSGRHVVIYNSSFDRRFFPGSLVCAAKVSCAMNRFAAIYHTKNPASRRQRSKKLIFAAKYIGHVWAGTAHRALADADATRALWHWMDAAEQAADPILASPKVLH